MARVCINLAVALTLALAIAALHTAEAVDYKPIVQNILAAAQNNTEGLSRLSYMCDQFGPRLSGSQGLENALSWIEATMLSDQLDNVTAQPVMVPKWVRGQEWLRMTQPRAKTLAVLGLGGSIGTPPQGIVASVLVVTSFDDLESKAAQAKGRIVVYNVPFKTYGSTVVYRSNGAAEAAKYGAVASLTRSITPYSLYTPHTGSMSYSASYPKIPAGAITVEDAELLQRMQNRGQTPILHLYMDHFTDADALSHNVMGEITGSELPNEVVVIGGHIDSWDVGQGAQDDGGGCLVSWEAVRLLKQLGLRPRRTVRAVLFTNEENGGRGAKVYSSSLTPAQLNDTVFAMESDSGISLPVGLSFDGTGDARQIPAGIALLLAPTINLTVTPGGAGADVGPLAALGVPAAGLSVADYTPTNPTYFNYHHTNADTIDHIDPADFNLCLGAFAALAYVIADMPQTLPRKTP